MLITLSSGNIFGNLRFCFPSRRPLILSVVLLLCLRPSLPCQPLGLFQVSPTAVGFLWAPHIVHVMRSACIVAYPDPNHYLRRNITLLVTHSMHVTTTVALAQAGISIEDIAFRLRWSPQSVTTYLCNCTQQIGSLTHASIVAGGLVLTLIRTTLLLACSCRLYLARSCRPYLSWPRIYAISASCLATIFLHPYLITTFPYLSACYFLLVLLITLFLHSFD